MSSPLRSTSGPSSAAEEPLPLSLLEVERKELANGLTVLVNRDMRAPVVSLQCWCATGSIHEGRWIGSGISHLLEHLLFKGTPTRTGIQMVQEIQDLGGHFNAYTTYERTVYHIDLPAESWRQALPILGDAVLHPEIDLEEFTREKDVIRREFAMVEDDPESQLFQAALETTFLRHPVRFPIIGQIDLFNALSREDVVAYHRERYVPQNLFLVVSGAAEPDEVFQAAEQCFGRESRRFLSDTPLPAEPVQVAARYARKAFPSELARIAILYPVPEFGHPDSAALRVLALFLGESRSSILHQKLVEQESLAEEVEAFTFAGPEAGVFGVEARCAPERLEKLAARLREELYGIGASLPAEADLTLARRLTLARSIADLKTMAGKAGAVGSGWLLARDPYLKETFLRLLLGVTAEEVQRVARQYLLPQKENRIDLVPLDFKPPAHGSRGGTHPGSRLTPSLTKVGGGFRMLSLEDSLPLQFFRAAFDGGLLFEPRGKEGICFLSTQLLLKGTRNRTAARIAREVEELGGSIAADAGNNSAGLSLEVLSDQWAPALQLFLEMLLEPAFREEEIATEKRKQLSLLQAERDDPLSIARDLVRRSLWGEHPYGGNVLGKEESLASIDAADVENFLRKVLLTNRLILAGAGPVDPAKWQPVIVQAMASRLGAATTLPSPPLPPRLSQPVRAERRVPGKEQAIVEIAFPIPELVHPDQLALAVVGESLSDLGSRLFVRVRDELGLAYFVSASRFVGRQAGYFYFYAGTAPGKEGEVERILLEEIIRLAEGGLSEKELERARAKLISEEKMSWQNPASIMTSSALHELVGLGWDYDERRLHRLGAMGLDEVNRVLRSYFETKGYVVGIVRP
ncbi:M16 family metallopeptidase [Methylacidimicrobium tartarophylax]|uniref:Zinc protease n=1 Tax=Methylacidimicrobium tartarophylax TaxID=1041768 RepID=A0A5E6M7I8_9BACT|nr:pitrilysin family protein [Methylacidimicrobium tartarophylax]VVM05322.1 zinc protease [Methylacidimicrobium tartarophylax]